MKIGSPADKTPVAPVTTGTAPAGPSADKTPTAAAAAEASAQVELSSAAATLMSGVGGANAEFDAEKVQRIAQAIADGTFQVDPAAIADKLIANAQELLDKPSH